ncbi:MAG TPA: helix-hairpin-helix domain-containing protein, partial [Candidatus Parabacteroides intestinavium]|nr:helix-hairpin-helix domain-containing protein [Candidatus Parabacteroides intestinavium]
MKNWFITPFISLFITCYSVYSQQTIPVDKWKEYVEDLADESLDEARLETLYADLSYLSEHPMDLNEVTRDQLSRLPFLSDRQIEQIVRYRKRVERFVSLYELKGIEDMDFQTIQLVLPFVYVGEKSVDKIPFTVKNLLKYGSNELLFRYDQCFQQKKGYGSYPDSVLQKYPNRKYLGEPF